MAPMPYLSNGLLCSIAAFVALLAILPSLALVEKKPIVNAKNLAATTAVITEGAGILKECAPKGETNPADGENCLREKAKGKKLPYDLIAAVHHWYLASLNDAKQKEAYASWKNAADADKTTREVLGTYVPMYKTIAMAQKGDMGPGVVEVLFEKALSGTTFKKEFSNQFYDRTQNEALGNKKQVSGAVYKIKMSEKKSTQSSKDLVMKIVLPKPGNDGKLVNPPTEFTIHQQLSEQFGATSPTHFIPEYIINGQKDLGGRMFNYMVMERFGDTVTNWFQHKDPNMRPTTQQIELFLARSFAILRELHKAGYVHGDNHMTNWALSQKNKNTLFLYDFDQTRKMGANFGYVLEDLQRWVDMMSSIVEDLQLHSRELDFQTLLTTKKEALGAALNPTLWFNPDDHLKYAHFSEYALPTYDALMAKAQLQLFMKIVNDWLKPDEHTLKTVEQITSWQPK